MISQGTPIKSIGEDKLKKSDFVKRLCTSIIELPKSDSSFVVGLYGKWGTGKTSILNMLEEMIVDYNESQENAYEKKPIIIHFDPWLFTNETQLVYQFFSVLKNDIFSADGVEETIANKIGEHLVNYADVIGAVAGIVMPPIAIFSKPIAYGTRSIGKTLAKKQDMNEKNAYDIKKNLSEELGELNKKFVIIIDDIDRLKNEHIILIDLFPNL